MHHSNNWGRTKAGIKLTTDTTNTNTSPSRASYGLTLVKIWEEIYGAPHRIGSMRYAGLMMMKSFQWHHNGRDGVSNHRCLDCLLNRLFRRRSKKISKLCVTALCEGNLPVTVEFPSQGASNAENVFIWWRYHDSDIPHGDGPWKVKSVISLCKRATYLGTCFYVFIRTRDTIHNACLRLNAVTTYSGAFEILKHDTDLAWITTTRTCLFRNSLTGNKMWKCVLESPHNISNVWITIVINRLVILFASTILIFTILYKHVACFANEKYFDH